MLRALPLAAPQAKPSLPLWPLPEAAGTTAATADASNAPRPPAATGPEVASSAGTKPAPATAGSGKPASKPSPKPAAKAAAAAVTPSTKRKSEVDASAADTVPTDSAIKQRRPEGTASASDGASAAPSTGAGAKAARPAIFHSGIDDAQLSQYMKQAKAKVVFFFCLLSAPLSRSGTR